MDCLLLGQRTQLEALVLGGRVTAQTEKHPHTLCVACATSALTGSVVCFFFEGKKFNKGVKHPEYIKNVDEIKYVTTNLKYVTTSHGKKLYRCSETGQCSTWLEVSQVGVPFVTSRWVSFCAAEQSEAKEV